MEGLIPFVCRAIASYANSGGAQAPPVTVWFAGDSPSASYMRLPTGDSGRFRPGAEVQVFSSPLPHTAGKKENEER
ncbi:hypothetical protein ZIOFF_048941 [Zingiber officinale]|uniref:Uncharacterized protein n=1 Tax=Zingiber officinale TaxID=94328 RepID=A0A8J5FW04_ZINOF|nr:hypothetical protein ZIOFF_048941 [Zingiber officinale]